MASLASSQQNAETMAETTETKGEEQLEEQGREVQTKDLEEALAALRDPTVTKLDVSNAKFGAEGAEKIAEGLQHENCRVTNLNLRNNNIGGAKGVVHLVRALQHENCRVTDLNLRRNKIGDVGLEHLSRALQHENCRVTDLDLSGNEINAAGVEHLIRALQHENCHVTNLNLDANNIGAEGVEHLVRVLQHENCRVTNLNLGVNKIGDKGAEHLVRALQHENCHVTNLNLEYNKIDQSVLDRIQTFMDATVERAAAREEAKKKQEEKVMQEKKLEDALAALRDPTVTTLVVSWMNFGAEDVEKIAEGLQHKNCHVTNLSLWGNKIGDEGVEHLSRALQHENCHVTDLNLYRNNIGDEGVAHLVRALQHENCRVTILNLAVNNIGAEGVEHLVRALQHENCRVTNLDLDGNGIDQSVLDKLMAMMKRLRKELKALEQDNGWVVPLGTPGSFAAEFLAGQDFAADKHVARLWCQQQGGGVDGTEVAWVVLLSYTPDFPFRSPQLDFFAGEVGEDIGTLGAPELVGWALRRQATNPHRHFRTDAMEANWSPAMTIPSVLKQWAAQECIAAPYLGHSLVHGVFNSSDIVWISVGSGFNYPETELMGRRTRGLSPNASMELEIPEIGGEFYYHSTSLAGYNAAHPMAPRSSCCLLTRNGSVTQWRLALGPR